MRHLLTVLLIIVAGMLISLPAAEALLPADPADTAPAPAAPAAPARVAPADADAVKSASVLVREVYAGRYAVKTDSGRRTLGRMMLRHAAWHRSNAALMEVLLRESLRLACEADDHETMLAAIDALAAAFTGVSVADERNKAFQEIARKPFVVAMQKLSESPDDVRSLAVAGRWLGPVAGRWAEALPLLARASGDPLLQKAAEGELAASTPMQVLQVAETWMEALKRSKGEERVGMLKHVHELVTRALPDLTGISKTKADQLIATVEPQIPLDLDQVDWSTLTGAQWERIAAKPIPLLAKTDRTDSGITLAAGETVRVVANPDDRWSFQLVGEEKTPLVTDWKGVRRLYTYTISDDNGVRSVTISLGLQGILYGAVVAFTDVNNRMRAGIIRGPGKLMLGPASNRRGEAGTAGTMRVKIVPVDE